MIFVSGGEAQEGLHVYFLVSFTFYRSRSVASVQYWISMSSEYGYCSGHDVTNLVLPSLHKVSTLPPGSQIPVAPTPSIKSKSVMRRLLLLLSLLSPTLGAEKPPPFFLQDPQDSLCLAGNSFGRCSLDTLWFVTGSPGAYQVHAYEQEDQCLATRECDNDTSDLLVAPCDYCGAANWNILGDADSGYVLVRSETACLTRNSEKNNDDKSIARMMPCQDTTMAYTPLTLQFASPAELKTMSSPGARVVAAAAAGDLEGLQTLVQDDNKVLHERDWDDLTALIAAASGGHLKIVQYLVASGLDVNAHDKDGITALHEASVLGHLDICKYLLEQGATLEQTSQTGVTALWLASSSGQTKTMEFLLEQGADASIERQNGVTALHTAAVGGHTDSISLLLQHKATPQALDKDGLTPLINAAEKGSTESLQLLLQAVPEDERVDYVNTISTTGFTALIIASAHGHADAVQYLMDQGANVDVRAGENDVTALMYAAASDHVNVVKALLTQASVDVQHSNGGTALLEAATGGARTCLQALVDAGAAPDAMDQDGVTPLMAIASQGNLQGQEVILKALQAKFSAEQVKEHINQLSFSGGSSVMFAAAGGHTDCAKRLVELGANVHDIAQATPEYLTKIRAQEAEGIFIEDEPHVDGVTALHVAAQGGFMDMVKQLLEWKVEVTVYDEDKRSALTMALKNNHADVAQVLVQAGADPDTPMRDDDNVEHNALFQSIVEEQTDLAATLLEKGANIYYLDDKRVSTLLQACHKGYTNLVELMLKMYVSTPPPEDMQNYLDLMSAEGVTPILAAASEGHDEVVTLLLQAGASANLPDEDETTPLMAASARGHVQVVQALLSVGGASINTQNKDGHTALMFAYHGKNQIETLWQRYLDFAQGSEEQQKEAEVSGTGPILSEALDNHLKLVELLLKQGADPHIKDKEGNKAKDFDYSKETDPTVPDVKPFVPKGEAEDQAKKEL